MSPDTEQLPISLGTADGSVAKKVVGQAWEYSIHKAQDSVPTFVVPSAPIALVAVTTNNIDLDGVPLATAIAVDDNDRMDI